MAADTGPLPEVTHPRAWLIGLAAILVLAAMVFHGKDGIRLPQGDVVTYDKATRTYKNPKTGETISDDEVTKFRDPEEN